jgi:glycosyltransferase involved in cell wall biosynthesis
MRILHIVGTLSPAAGGPTEAIRLLIQHAPLGVTGEVATLDSPSAPFLTQPHAFPVHPLGTTPGRWYSPHLIPWLRDNRRRFDGIVVHGLWEFTGLAARLAAPRTPRLVFPHGMLDPYFRRAFPTKHLRKQLYWLLAECWNLCSARRVLFTTTREQVLAAHTFFPSRWTPALVPLGTEPPQPVSPEAFYNICPTLGDQRFLLFLGRIDPKKGCDLLMQAFRDAAPLDLHLVMAGPDPTHWQPHLEDLAGPAAARIHWPGLLQGDAKLAALAACEAFILPSHQENFGIAVVEALAHGKPVLLSDQVNIAEDIHTDACGLIQPDTEAGTLALLRNWLDSTASQREEMSRRAETTFAKRYNIRQNAAALYNLFDLIPNSDLEPRT